MIERLRVLIADDEPPARAVLRDLLLAHDDVDLCAECGDGRETFGAIARLRPEIVFLDVQMPGLDGFEVLAKLRTGDDPYGPDVVFVTAYDEFAVRAFDVHAVDYLVKPFTDARFETALARARARRRGTRDRAGSDLASVLAQLEEGARVPAPPGHFLVRTGRRSVLVAVEEIAWIEADSYYATLHLPRGEGVASCGATHLVRETMASLEARLDPARFLRIHRGAIVNLRKVRELLHAPPSRLSVVLVDGTSLEVSRSRRDLVLQRLAAAAPSSK